MVALDDDEIEASRREAISASRSKARRDAALQESRRKQFSKKAYEALRMGDERAFAEQLRQANVQEDSEEWKRAWEYFRANSRRP